MKEFMEINGKSFVVKKELPFNQTYDSFSYNGRDLFDCYANPSSTKQYVWHNWYSWFTALNLDYTLNDGTFYSMKFGVRSYNCNFFSIHGIIRWQGSWFYVDITSSHNYIHHLV